MKRAVFPGFALAVLFATALAAAGSAPPEKPVAAAKPVAAGGPAESASKGKPAPPAEPMAKEDLLWRHRNLGKAFYENPTTQYQAVDELKAAWDLAPDSARERLNYGLALLRAGKMAAGIAELQAVQRQDPSLPHTWWNLGIAYKKDSQDELAIAQLEGMVARVPDEAAAHYNLGVLYKVTGKADRALPHLEVAVRLDPGLAGPHFQLYNVYKQAGRSEEAARELARFQEIKKAQAGAAVPEDLEWSFYSELYDPPAERAPAAAPPADQAVDPLVDSIPPRFAAIELARGLDAATAWLVLLPPQAAEGDARPDRPDRPGRPDLLAGSAAGIRLYAGGEKAVEAAGLEAVRGALAAVPGDFDNDGLADLCVLGATGAKLWANRKGRFEELSVALPAGPFRAAVWLDFDHDYDLDLLLLGAGAALARNNGDGTWSDQTARFPFLPGRALAAAVMDSVADTQEVDVAVAYEDHPGVLYRDRLGGRFEAEPLAALPAGARGLAARDFDGDGWTDLAAAAPAGLVLLANGRAAAGPAVWRPLPAPPIPPVPQGTASGPFAFADFESRGQADLVAGGTVFRGAGRGAFASRGTTIGPIGPAGPGRPTVALAAADLDADGREDLAAIDGDGVLRLQRNAAESPNRSLRVTLQGVKNLKLATAARVEVKAGALYQKQLYSGTPLVFGLGRRESADAVRITWPNGLIQNETRQPAGAKPTYKEAQRLSGSCPMIFTWDGARFRFITDVLGVAPLGASSGDGEYFPVDHDEYVQIPGEALAEVDGRYEVRVTEELREVSYLDRLQLTAVDHPRDVDVFTNDKFKGPPFPEFRLFGVKKRSYPVRAVDGGGQDVRDRLLARDGTYPDSFRRDYAGVAEVHTLDLDFGAGAAPDGRAVLVLAGWVDWADGSTFLGSAQGRRPGQPAGLLMPQLQVKDAAGQWRTVVEDMGIPSGKPKAIVVDLAGKFLSPSREVRIVTNLCVYWDEIFLAAADPLPGRLSSLDPATADLRFRGFSTPAIHPERKQPESFDYSRLLAQPPWNPTPGLYTRYGDVRALVGAVDDQLLVMGSGDEVRLTFDARSLPPLPPGWRRDFLLLVDGWAKDGDANTAFSQTVEPLPFHAMTRYPYPQGERFPDDPEHTLYRETYETRPALRLVRPLAEAGATQR